MNYQHYWSNCNNFNILKCFEKANSWYFDGTNCLVLRFKNVSYEANWDCKNFILTKECKNNFFKIAQAE